MDYNIYKLQKMSLGIVGPETQESLQQTRKRKRK